MVISGIYAAKLEQEGIGTLLVDGRTIIFVQCDGLRVAWDCKTVREAKDMLRLFRSAARERPEFH